MGVEVDGDIIGVDWNNNGWYWNVMGGLMGWGWLIIVRIMVGLNGQISAGIILHPVCMQVSILPYKRVTSQTYHLTPDPRYVPSSKVV
jgi:hypothetical protein